MTVSVGYKKNQKNIIFPLIADKLINKYTKGQQKIITVSVLIQKYFLYKETSTYWKLKDKIFKIF